MAKNAHTETHRLFIERFKHPSGDASGYISDDFSWSDEYIIRELLSRRSSLIKARIDAGKEISDQVVQTLNCVEVEEHDRNDCPCMPPSGCYWMRSKVELPKFIKISSVTGAVTNTQMPTYTYKRWDMLKYIPTDRIPSVRNGKYWTTRDSGGGRFLYLYGDRFIESVTVSGIWENPMEAAAFPSCGVQNKEALCNPFDVPIYTDDNLKTAILQLAWQELLPVRQTAPEDRKNNDNSKL